MAIIKYHLTLQKYICQKYHDELLMNRIFIKVELGQNVDIKLQLKNAKLHVENGPCGHSRGRRWYDELRNSLGINTVLCVKYRTRGKLLYNTRNQPGTCDDLEEWDGRSEKGSRGREYIDYICRIYNIYTYISMIYVCCCTAEINITL